MFCPNRFDTANATSRARLAATSAGSTVAANAASKTPTTTRACPATASAAAATEPNHPAYGAAAAAASNGLDPAPEYISTELISGGNTGNSITHSPSQPDTNPHRHPPHDVSTPR
ncbi:Uncharacterised protein [Mycobacterium tuberculosis]|nr:Uncharacterised protein [Mycobacterium tuberculosis]